MEEKPLAKTSSDSRLKRRLRWKAPLGVAVVPRVSRYARLHSCSPRARSTCHGIVRTLQINGKHAEIAGLVLPATVLSIAMKIAATFDRSVPKRTPYSFRRDANNPLGRPQSMHASVTALTLILSPSLAEDTQGCIATARDRESTLTILIVSLLGPTSLYAGAWTQDAGQWGKSSLPHLIFSRPRAELRRSRRPLEAIRADNASFRQLLPLRSLS